MRFAWLAALTGTLASSLALAQPALPSLPPPPDPSTSTSTSTPTPTPPPIPRCAEPSGAYCHDGFYLRLALGPAYTSLAGHARFGSASITGPGGALMVAVGGTVAPGLVVAGMIAGHDGIDDAPQGLSGRTIGDLTEIGLLVDWYPRPAGGWHVGGAAGFGVAVVSDSFRNDFTATGLGGLIFGGYDWWVGEQWSLGLMLVGAGATSAPLRDANSLDTGYRFTPISAALEGSLLFH